MRIALRIDRVPAAVSLRLLLLGCLLAALSAAGVMKAAAALALYFDPVETCEATELGEGMQLAFRRLAADTGRERGTHFAVFVYSDGDARLRGFRYLEDAPADFLPGAMSESFLDGNAIIVVPSR